MNIATRIRKFNHGTAIRYWSSLSLGGIFFAALCFTASMTPSLLPRSFQIQGLLSGAAAAFGYGCGVLFDECRKFLQVRNLSATASKRTRIAVLTTVALLIGLVLWRASFWQNSVRSLMKIPPVAATYPLTTGILALIVAMLLIAFARLMIRMCISVARRLTRFVPRRLAYILSAIFVFMSFLVVSNQVVIRSLLNAADNSFARIDGLSDEGIHIPQNSLQCGSKSSLIPWESIGRRGKRFIVSGPSQQKIEKFHQKECREPLRVFVGWSSRPTLKERAQLAVEELKRIRAFDRSLLVVATPTGTGWIDPSAVDPLEYLHAGNTAIVALQYSYLPSWLTLIVDPERPKLAAKALFKEVYAHWKDLPKDKRPKLYLHGLSLGALGSESSADFLTIFEDPIDGALWSGPPFPSAQWASLTAIRNEGSPSWRPEIRDSRMVRFQNQSQKDTDQEDKGPTQWGPIRCIYLQHASDPMVFFSPDLMFSEPDWLKGQRGSDVSECLRWFPIVTSLQIAFDLPLATNVPMGFGHNYAPSDYIDAWGDITSPVSISSAQVTALKAIFADRTPPSF